MKRESQNAHWLDHFSLAKIRNHPPGPLDVLFQSTFGGGKKPQAAGCVQLLPGVEALDLYSTSVRTEIWKDGEVVPCRVPQALIGWEFFSPLWPHPGGTTPLRLSAAVELLIGRQSGSAVCSSLLFAFVPASHLHGAIQSVNPAQTKAQIQTAERLSGNLDADCRTLSARLLVLCPSSVYKESMELPDEQNWGLFIGPRSRTLVLLNRCRGRIDLNLASLLAIDGVFRLGQSLIAATARLFEAFGTQAQVPALFGASFDPLKVHSGFTNATVVDHLRDTSDGREDYWQMFGVKLPTFFLSNASNNMCFLTPVEAQQFHAGTRPVQPSDAGPLPDMPRWSLQGLLTEADRNQLIAYRIRTRPLMPVPDSGGGFMQLLGSGDWFPLLAGCTEMSVSNDRTAVGQSPGVGQGVAQGISQAPGQATGPGLIQATAVVNSSATLATAATSVPGASGDPEPEPQAWIQAKNAKTLGPGRRSESGSRNEVSGRQNSRGGGEASGTSCASASGGSRSVSAERRTATDLSRHDPSTAANEH